MENRIEQPSIGALPYRQAAPSTAQNIVFLFLSFPLGQLYFVVIITGFSLGVGTLVVWVGLPILFATFFCVRAFAEVERRLVSGLLHVPMQYRVLRSSRAHPGFLRRFGRLLSDPYTWTSMVYMILKLPLGILSFTLALTLLSFSVALLLLPLIYLINVGITIILALNGIMSGGYIIPGFIEIHGSFESLVFFRSFAGVPIGIVLWIITRYLLNGLALVSGELARVLLGPGVSYRVAEPHAANEPEVHMTEHQQWYHGEPESRTRYEQQTMHEQRMYRE